MSDTNEQTTDTGGTDFAAELADLKAQLERVNAKNQELVREKQAAKSAAAQAKEEADAQALQAAERSGDIEALKAAHAKEIEKLQAKVDTYDSDLRTIRVDNEIARAISEGNVRPEMVRAVTAMMKAEVSYKDGVATIADKPIADYATEFLGGQDGAHFVRAADNSGSTSPGGSAAKVAGHGFTKDNFRERMTEWSMLSKTSPDLAKTIAIEVGRADLASSI